MIGKEIMALDEQLAQRIRNLLAGQPGWVEKRMFGGIGFLVQGNMACGVNQDQLIVRVGPQDYDQALSKSEVGVFDLTGKPMRGWITVAPAGIATEEQLSAWINTGVAFAKSLPPK